jgi:hypothetical protein
MQTMEDRQVQATDAPTDKGTPPEVKVRGGNWLRNTALGCIIVFFGLLSFAVITFMLGLNRTQETVVEPLTNLVQQLALPVTPVILPNPATIVREINDLARLETASFEYEKVITAETRQDVLWGLLGESLVFVAYGKVYAGVDFAEMAATDLQVYDPQTVHVHLPEVEIFADIPVLDNELSYVADRDTGLLTRANPDLETEVRQAAEMAIREAAVESEILERARTNAESYMTNFLQGLGFTNIVFTDRPPDPAPPFEQEAPKGFIITPEAP